MAMSEDTGHSTDQSGRLTHHPLSFYYPLSIGFFLIALRENLPIIALFAAALMIYSTWFFITRTQ